ncbi:MAG: N-acetyl-gamma-glutamyl-phosphate reductase [Actinobacteria bacterium]|uniref:N-acetyl-gamma-glutamyl-phosphate reductase n=1 Tax=freshwater metagenome TaxID=449393 RepID=A0A6J6FMF5_9ZZZZ|nr:N-acetyl-gamma-glutamyl-phosphate reductase [Actinomycetota bacterium]
MKIGVIGASGYAGGELLRLLAGHPKFEVCCVTAHSNAGELITSVHPQLTAYSDRKFSAFNASDFDCCELIFLALPHGESSTVIANLNPKAKIVDLGADYRLEDSAKWQKYYGGDHAGTWTYGAPEIPGAREAIAKSSRVANPGCYATAIALGTIPAAKIADISDVVVVAASGTTGAGRSAKINLIASEVMGSLTSYKFGGVHQHTPEIEEALTRATGVSAKISFTPILAPMPRGILATITMKLNSDISSEAAHKIYEDAYKSEEFVQVLPVGQMPQTSSVLGSNYVAIQVAVDSHTNRLVVSVAIDNLVKGAAGQAMQNANLICGFPENLGLSGLGLGV